MFVLHSKNSSSDTEIHHKTILHIHLDICFVETNIKMDMQNCFIIVLMIHNPHHVVDGLYIDMLMIHVINCVSSFINSIQVTELKKDSLIPPVRRSRTEKIVTGALILTSACRLAAIQIDISEDTTLLEAEKMCISKGQIPRISLMW